MDGERPTDQREQHGGDHITVGNITRSVAVAIGRGAQAIVNLTLLLPRWLAILLAVTAVVLLGSGLALTTANIGGVRQALRDARLLPPPFESEQPGETLIVIAPFFHPEGVPDDQEAELIRAGIDEQIQALGMTNVRVGVDDGSPIRAEDRDGAQALGERYKASMVIWGSNTRPQITVNYLNLRQPGLNAAQTTLQEMGEEGRTQLANPSDYAGFITSDLPKSMSFLTLFAMGQSAIHNQDYLQATSIISSAVELLRDVKPSPPGAVDAFFRLGWLFQVPGQDSERAIAAYSEAIDHDPKNAKIYVNRGNARYDTGDLNGALADLDQAIALDPNMSTAYFNRGFVRYVNGDLDGALADYSQVIALHPMDAEAYNGRGIARAETGDLDGALADYSQAIALDSKYTKAFHNRGIARYANGDLDGALADFDQAIVLDSKYTKAYYNRGNARYGKGDLDGALADFDQAIALDSKYAAAYNARGIARAETGDLDGALADFDQAIALDPNVSTAYYNRGNVRYGNGDLDGALADYSQAIALDPKKALAYYNRGLIYQHRHQSDLAIVEFQKARDLFAYPQQRQAAVDRLSELGVNQ